MRGRRATTAAAPLVLTSTSTTTARPRPRPRAGRAYAIRFSPRPAAPGARKNLRRPRGIPPRQLGRKKAQKAQKKPEFLRLLRLFAAIPSVERVWLRLRRARTHAVV